MKVLQILLAAVCLTALLCGCSREAKVVGMWVSCGTADIEGGDEFELYRATEWTFTEDGTAIVTVDGETTEYAYSMTHNTLTLKGDPVSHGILYKVKGDVFSLYIGGDRYADFERVEE